MSKAQFEQLSKMGVPEDKVREYQIAFSLFDPEGKGITTQKLAQLYNGVLGTCAALRGLGLHGVAPTAVAREGGQGRGAARGGGGGGSAAPAALVPSNGA